MRCLNVKLVILEFSSSVWAVKLAPLYRSCVTLQRAEYYHFNNRYLSDLEGEISRYSGGTWRLYSTHLYALISSALGASYRYLSWRDIFFRSWEENFIFCKLSLMPERQTLCQNLIEILILHNDKTLREENIGLAMFQNQVKVKAFLYSMISQQPRLC